MIRLLDAQRDLAAVKALYARSSDYWALATRGAPDPALAAAFFTLCPPGCDPGETQRLGLFQDRALVGVAELSFGFPAPGDGYLGLQILIPEARGKGLGRIFLREIEARARATGAGRLYLGVLEENPRGWAFWRREGFRETGVSRFDAETGHVLHRLVKDLGPGAG